MTSSTIDQLPTGHRVFVDSTIFIYHFTGASPACRAFLERCERLELDAFTSVIVLAEVTHRLMMIEAVASGMITPGNVAKKLREKPEAVKKLRLHAEQVARIPEMGIEVTPFDVDGLAQAHDLRRRHGLMVNDSLVCVAAMAVGAKALVSADRDFERVNEVALFRPADLA